MFNLPESISKSSILSSTQLELLVEVKELPTVNPSFTDDRLKNIFQYYSLTPEEMDAEIIINSKILFMLLLEGQKRLQYASSNGTLETALSAVTRHLPKTSP